MCQGERKDAQGVRQLRHVQGGGECRAPHGGVGWGSGEIPYNDLLFSLSRLFSCVYVSCFLLSTNSHSWSTSLLLHPFCVFRTGVDGQVTSRQVGGQVAGQGGTSPPPCHRRAVVGGFTFSTKLVLAVSTWPRIRVRCVVKVRRSACCGAGARCAGGVRKQVYSG